MMLSPQRWFDRGEPVTCTKTLAATFDGRAVEGPAVTGTIVDDQGMGDVWVRDAAGNLHVAMRADVHTECKECGEWHGARCPWLNSCQYCARPSDDYEPSAEDAAVMSAERLCEECHASAVRAAAMERRDAMRESYGDWLRDEGKDRRAW